MSLQKTPLRKLLQLFYAPANLRTSKIREDIRKENAKADGKKSGNGGDFHVPFWSDAKQHALGAGDLQELVEARIAADSKKSKLYPLLAQGFLAWWDEKRRWRNEPLAPLGTPSGTQLALPEIAATVKIEGTMALESGPNFHRIIYPYFSENPNLPPEGARLALWAMSEVFLLHKPKDLRVLDVLRGTSAGIDDYPLLGDEREIFLQRYRFVLSERDRLSVEYL